MAYANNRGLNEVHVHVTTPGAPAASMDSTKSRITKFGFVMKKSNGDTKKASPGSSASPVSRSKSMKVQRPSAPLVHKAAKHSNSIDNDEDVGMMKTINNNLHGLQTPTSLGIPKSQPGSRSTTPSTSDISTSGQFTRSVIVDRDGGVVSKSPKTHSRSSSFSSREKFGVNSASPSLRRPTVHGPMFDNKTRPQKTGDTSKGFRRTPSNSRTTQSDDCDGNIESSYSKPVQSGILRKPETRRTSIGSQNGRRPSSLIYTEKSPDLNQLASEISQTMNETGVFGSTSPRIPSSRTRVGSSRQTGTAHVKSDSSKLVSKLRPPIARNSSEEGNRPASVTANYKNEVRNVSRPRSAADMHKISTNHQLPSHHHQPPSSSSTSTSTGIHVNNNSRSSTPSSGRTTPQYHVPKSIAEEETTRTQPVLPMTTPRRPVQSRVGRAPFFYSTKSAKAGGNSIGMTADAVGLNELEGAVLLDAEDYRRMLQEVKTLKSVLLRLKRELTADGGVTVPSSSSANAKHGAKVDDNAELCKQIERLTNERNKARVELESSQKKQKLTETKLDQVNEDLKGSKKENNELKNKVHFLDSHRESLLDKVERLHADKHKLQDRLNTLEKSVMYESTILNDDWTEDIYDESINNGFDYDDEDATY